MENNHKNNFLTEWNVILVNKGSLWREFLVWYNVGIVKVTLKVHVHKDLDHRSDTGEGAADLDVIDYLWARLKLEDQALEINSKWLLGIIKWGEKQFIISQRKIL